MSNWSQDAYGAEFCSGCGCLREQAEEYVNKGFRGCCPDMPGGSSFIEFENAEKED